MLTCSGRGSKHIMTTYPRTHFFCPQVVLHCKYSFHRLSASTKKQGFKKKLTIIQGQFLFSMRKSRSSTIYNCQSKKKSQFLQPHFWASGCLSPLRGTRNRERRGCRAVIYSFGHCGLHLPQKGGGAAKHGGNPQKDRERPHLHSGQERKTLTGTINNKLSQTQPL